MLGLGAATLILRDVRFLNWKPTIFLWLVAVVAVGSAWFSAVPLAQRLLQPMIEHAEALPRALWLKLNWVWVVFYALLGALNLWIAYHRSERDWVNFKFSASPWPLRCLRFAGGLACLAPRSTCGRPREPGLMNIPAANTLASTARRIEQLLQQRLEPTHLEVRDESAAHVGHANAGKGHFRVKVVSTCFAG